MDTLSKNGPESTLTDFQNSVRNGDIENALSYVDVEQLIDFLPEPNLPQIDWLKIYSSEESSDLNREKLDEIEKDIEEMVRNSKEQVFLKSIKLTTQSDDQTPEGILRSIFLENYGPPYQLEEGPLYTVLSKNSPSRIRIKQSDNDFVISNISTLFFSEEARLTMFKELLTQEVENSPNYQELKEFFCLEFSLSGILRTKESKYDSRIFFTIKKSDNEHAKELFVGESDTLSLLFGTFHDSEDAGIVSKSTNKIQVEAKVERLIDSEEMVEFLIEVYDPSTTNQNLNAFPVCSVNE